MSVSRRQFLQRFAALAAVAAAMPAEVLKAPEPKPRTVRFDVYDRYRQVPIMESATSPNVKKYITVPIFTLSENPTIPLAEFKARRFAVEARRRALEAIAC